MTPFGAQALNPVAMPYNDLEMSLLEKDGIKGSASSTIFNK